MALFKPVKQSNGLVLNYHKIVYVKLWTNSHISIAVYSYVDKNMREEESANNDIYKVSKTYELPYDENFTVESAYEYLKTLPDFEGSEDV